MPKGGSDHISYRQVQVGCRGHDQSIFAGGFPKERHIWSHVGETLSRVISAGQNHAFYSRISHQLGTQRVFVSDHVPDNIAGQLEFIKGRPDGLHNHSRCALSLRGRFDDHG
jgi:hypothetical protein